MRSQLLVILACLIFTVFLPTVSMGGGWRDDFSGAELGPGWEFSNKPEQCVYEVADGWFSIHLEGVNDIWAGKDNSAKLLRDAPDGDYTIETYIVIEPDESAGTAGTWTAVILFDDSTHPSLNWWYVARGHNDEVTIEYVRDGVATNPGHTGGVSDMKFYLKAEKVGQEYTGYYKIQESDEWIEVGTLEHMSLNPLKVGFCVKSWENRSIVSNFDYVEITGSEVEGTAVIPNEKLTATWGQLKGY